MGPAARHDAGVQLDGESSRGAEEPARITVRSERIDGPVATALIRGLSAELKERYGAGESGFVDPARFCPPTGAFLVAYVDGRPAACAGIQRADERTAELKRMFVRQRYRRQGLGRTILAAVEDKARALGYEALRIETGVRQPDAIALYREVGYHEVDPFRLHEDDPDGVFFSKELEDHPA